VCGQENPIYTDVKPQEAIRIYTDSACGNSEIKVTITKSKFAASQARNGIPIVGTVRAVDDNKENVCPSNLKSGLNSEKGIAAVPRFPPTEGNLHEVVRRINFSTIREVTHLNELPGDEGVDPVLDDLAREISEVGGKNANVMVRVSPNPNRLESIDKQSRHGSVKTF
jgi:hypothetical protein